MPHIMYRETITPEVPTETISKGSPLSNQEIDGNFKSIADELATKSTTDSPTFTGTVILPTTTEIGSVDSTEIGYLSGVTSNIQAQIDDKSPNESPTFTGNPTAPTAPPGTETTQISTTAFAMQAASDAALALSIALG